MQLREFSGNVAHSDVDGLMFDRGPNAQGKFNLGGNTHLPYTDPSDTNSARLETVIKDFTSYKNSGAAIWARGENHVFKGLKLADSGIGYTHAYPGVAPYHGDFTSKVEDSLFVGETDNKGTPKTEAEIAYGRTMPRKDADYPIRGFEYYDFTHHLDEYQVRQFCGQCHSQNRSHLLPAVHQLSHQHQQRCRRPEIRKCQAGVFPTAAGSPLVLLR